MALAEQQQVHADGPSETEAVSVRVVLSGVGEPTLLSAIRDELRSAEPQVVGIASAFVSTCGVRSLIPVVKRARECRMIAGLDGRCTHPFALEIAQAAKWDVRVGTSTHGIFHPKLIVGGDRFSPDGHVIQPTFAYLGSGNLTHGGLNSNVEVGLLISRSETCLEDLAESIGRIWTAAQPLTADRLEEYAKEYATKGPSAIETERRELPTSDLSFSTLTKTASTADGEPIIGSLFATTVWVGVSSFTGEYALQVEFPKDAADIVRRMIGGVKDPERISVQCEDRVRGLVCGVYGMFRINLPNDLPGVARVREERSGILVVKKTSTPATPISVRILPPGPEAEMVAQTSFALNTWGRTSTRAWQRRW